MAGVYNWPGDKTGVLTGETTTPQAQAVG
jgi:hypothetical protein